MIIFFKVSRSGVLVQTSSSCRSSGVSAVCLPQVVEGPVFLYSLLRVTKGLVFLY